MRSVLAMLLLASSVARAQVPVERPSFCAGYAAQPDGNSFRWIDGYLQSDHGVSDRAMVLMAKSACDRPDDPERQKMLAGWRQMIVAERGVSPEFTLKMLRVRLIDDEWKKLNREKDDLCRSLEDGARESKRLLAEAVAVGHLLECPNATRPVVDWFNDETLETTEMMRLGQVAACWMRTDLGTLKTMELSEDVHQGMKSPGKLVRYAWCGMDTRRLDEKALFAEMDKDTRFTPGLKQLAQERFYLDKGLLARINDYYKKLADRDPDYKAVLFDAPEAAMAAWQKRYEGMKADFDKVIAVERKAHLPSRASAKGCSAELRPLLGKLLAGKTIERAETAKNALFESFIYRTVVALTFCEFMDGNYEVTNTLYYQYSGAGAYLRGPRWEAAVAAVEKMKQILVDRPKFVPDVRTYDMPTRDGEAALADIDLNKATISAFIGPIQSIKAQGDKTLVTFKKLTWNETLLNCVPTGAVERVDYFTGQVFQKQKCTPGATRSVSSQEAPILVPTPYAAGLKVGHFLKFNAPYAPKDRVGVPIIGFTDQKKDKVASYLGQKL